MYMSDINAKKINVAEALAKELGILPKAACDSQFLVTMNHDLTLDKIMIKTKLKSKINRQVEIPKALAPVFLKILPDMKDYGYSFTRETD